MHVVTVAARKGGAGKSTVSILLAALFAQAHLRALLIDTDDGQHTAINWASRRSGSAAVPSLTALAVEGSADLEAILARTHQSAIDFCVIDTPAGRTAVAGVAIAAADIVIIPTKCDGADRWAVRATVEAVLNFGKPFLIVPTEVPARRLGREASDLRRLRADLADLQASVWDGQLTERRRISYDLAVGRVPSETDWTGITNTECLRLWRRIMETLQVRNSHCEASRP